MFITESWFWRGTQSAIFYYVSCSPCVEFKYKQRRRKEAVRAEKERSDIITSQPGLIMQPGPFQTNPDWAEEIIMGPGPPKGWKKEKILQGYSESAREKYRNETQTPQPPPIGLDGRGPIPNEDEPTRSPRSVYGAERGVPTITISTSSEVITKPTYSRSRPSAEVPMSPITEVTSNATVSTTSSDQPEQPSRPRPSMDRRLSSAVENLKGTIKGWNWKRYEREDEILSGLNERLSRMWDKATNYGTEPGAEGRKLSFTYGRKRAGTTGTNESERYDYQRAMRYPEINELHPPTVSKLPMTRDEAAWMLLPPPSAAIMAGRCRPHDELAPRWPLAQIDRDQSERERLKNSRFVTRHRSSESTSSTNDSKRTPDLSNSSSEDGWSDGEDGENDHAGNEKRHSAPVEGWMPVRPKLSAQVLHPSTPQWGGDESIREQRVW